jgi:hypothetical protein
MYTWIDKGHNAGSDAPSVLYHDKFVLGEWDIFSNMTDEPGSLKSVQREGGDAYSKFSYKLSQLCMIQCECSLNRPTRIVFIDMG